jgi:methyl coenzyme M reductase alpha subunit
MKEEARRRAIQEAHEKAGHQIKAPVVLERPEAKIGNTQTRKVWTYEVTDFSKVPDDFKVINNVAVNQGIRDGLRNVLGLRIYQEEKLSIVGR